MEKNLFLLMVSEGSAVSHKRVITFFAFVLLAISFLLDLGFDIKVSDALLNIMETLVMFGFGSTVVEKFAKKQPALVGEKTSDQPDLPEENKNK
jgi:hypothetical protein